jgi:uncharacterized protein with beta-barrel porin domain
VTGLGSTAIYAQSADRSGFGGNIEIKLGNATTGTAQLVLGGAGGAATTNAVTFAGGAANTLQNYALLTTMSGIDGMTARGGVGDESVTNYGHMVGSIDLGTGVNLVNNKAYNNNPSTSAGVFDTGATINLGGNGAAYVLANDGLVSPGAFLRVLNTDETGNYTQTAAGGCGTFGAPTSTCGYFGIDLDLKAEIADRLNVSNVATVAGAVVVNIDNPGEATPGEKTLTLISATGGETHSQIELQSQPTAVATYELTYPNGFDIDLRYKIDFSPVGLTENQHAVGNAINAIQTAHVPTFVPIAAALFYQPTVKVLGEVYDRLSGEGITAIEQTSFNANDLFHSAILNETRYWLSDNEAGDANALTFGERWPLSYASAGRAPLPGKAPAAFDAQRTWRLWTTINGGEWRYSGNPVVGSANMSEHGAGFAAGLDYRFNQNVVAGVAVGHGNFSIAMPDRATVAGVEVKHAGVYAAVRDDNSYVFASVGFNSFANEESRYASIPGTVLPPLFGQQIPPVPGFSEHLLGNFSSYSVSGRIEAGHRFRYGALNVTPLIGTQFSSLWMKSFTETNNLQPSMIGLTLASRNLASVPAYAGMQFDQKHVFDDGRSFYGWMRATWVHEFETERSINPSFIAAPGFDFIIQGAPAAKDLARVGLGGKYSVNNSLAFTANFNADIYHTPSYAWDAGFRIAW